MPSTVASFRLENMKAINVFGLGLMGQQIVSLFLLMGYQVAIHSSRQINETNIHKQTKTLRRLLSMGTTALGSIVNPCDKIMNAVSIDATLEDLAVKQALYQRVRNANDRLFVTNTSSLKPLEIGEDAAGLHFFNPISMGLVETTQCSPQHQNDYDEITRDLCSVGFNLVQVKGNRGYLGNRLLFGEISNALKLIEVQNYSVSDIVTMYNHLYQGRDIFNIVDLIGVDVVKSIMENLAEDDHSFYVANCLTDAVNRKILGKKNRTSIRHLFDPDS